MSFAIYKIIHFAGVITLFLGFGLMIASSTGGKFSGSPQNRKAMMLHGIGLALILLGGFGMAAKAKFVAAGGQIGEPAMSQGFPLWFWTKFIVWLILGGLAAAIKRIPEKATLWTGLIIVLGLVAVFLGVSQPF
jgi:hypothetical protein